MNIGILTFLSALYIATGSMVGSEMLTGSGLVLAGIGLAVWAR